MKRALFAGWLLLSLLVAPMTSRAEPVDFDPLTESSDIDWLATHKGKWKVRGTFEDFDGHFVVDTVDWTQSSFALTIQTASLFSRNKMRDKHLRSDDFFDVAKWPTMEFTSTSVEPKGGGRIVVYGTCTVKGNSVKLAVPLDVRWEGHGRDHKLRLKGSFDVNRSDFDLTYQPKFPIPRIKEKVKVSIDILAQPETSSATGK